MTKQDLLDAPDVTSEALAKQAPSAGGDSLVLMFERLAKDPGVDVAKLEKLIELQERIMRHNAKAAFNGAFTRMQPDLPIITERGQIAVKGIVRSTYAKLEDIQDAIFPVLARFGFSLRHRTEWPSDKPNIIRIVGILSHEQGHSEESCFEAPMDKSEYRTDIQSQGSTVSYGRRYTTLDLLNVKTRGIDNDGRSATGQSAPADINAPAGFERWWDDMRAVADEGWAALSRSWDTSKPEYRNHVVQTNKGGWSALREKAKAVKA